MSTMGRAARTVPLFARRAVRDRRRHHAQPRTPLTASSLPAPDYLAAAHEGLDWLCRAQDATDDDGVSYGYSLRGGWLPSYRETSGYILTTFLRASADLGRAELADRAMRVASWLLTVQNPDGSFANPDYGPDGIVFDTGQDLFGLVAAYRHSGEQPYLDAAVRAGDWLARVADTGGLWTRYEHKNTPHVYNTRTAWALTRLGEVAPSLERDRVARANLDWALANQLPSGLFTNNAFVAGADPYLHTISYAVCGLQEAGWVLGEDVYVAAARRASEAVRALLRPDGFVPGQVTPQGAGAARYSCLTGQAQISLAWAKQFHQTDEPELRAAALSSLRFALAHRGGPGDGADVRGALPGSYPVWGRYAPFSYPNWATKFLVDACLLASGLQDARDG